MRICLLVALIVSLGCVTDVPDFMVDEMVDCPYCEDGRIVLTEDSPDVRAGQAEPGSFICFSCKGKGEINMNFKYPEDQ
jgi:DNA-directed RNA polymerase subunit RPC12/RpoP